MKTLRLFLCGLAASCVLPSCVYDDYPYGYSSVTYNRPSYYSYGSPYYGASYYSYGSPGYARYSPYYPYGSGYIYRTSPPRTYVTNRYMTPLGSRTYVSGYPLNPYMSVGAYGYIPPTPRPAPWPLR